MDKHFTVTTPIYYVNDKPHIGHAYTTIACDVFARHYRDRGVPTFFQTGTDEHGQKVETSAQKSGETPQQLADRVVKHFEDNWRMLNISNDHFIRTTHDYHENVVQDLWKKMADNGDIYLDRYESTYCVACETFWPENQLHEGNLCPNEWCHRPVEKHSEPSYFFRLSAYQDKLLELYEKQPDFVLPDFRMNEVRSFVERGLHDLSISRTSFNWGIPVPGDDKHVIYVWVDALINYVSGAGYLFNQENYETRWPATAHVVGKDIIVFHAVYWPAFLMSAGLPLPKHVYAHGFWNSEGEKMSKTRGNVVDPREAVATYGLDPFRYYLMREVPFGLDGDFRKENMVNRYNSELANDLGNTLSRTLAMTDKYLGGVLPAPTDGTRFGLAKAAETCQKEVADQLEAFKPQKALEAVRVLIDAANKAIVQQEPWNMAKDPDKADDLATLLYDLLELLRRVSIFLHPFMPETTEKIQLQLGLDIPEFQWTTLEGWKGLPEGTRTRRGDAIFPRLDAKKLKEMEENAKKEKPAPVEEETEGLAAIEYEDFTKVELKIGEILEAEKVKKADKLLKLSVNTGEGTPRTIVAGIAEHYAPETLIGKRVVVVANLKPRKLRGILSQGMLLAAKHDGKLTVLTTDNPELPGGSKVS